MHGKTDVIAHRIHVSNNTRQLIHITHTHTNARARREIHSVQQQHLALPVVSQPHKFQFNLYNYEFQNSTHRRPYKEKLCFASDLLNKFECYIYIEIFRLFHTPLQSVLTEFNCNCMFNFFLVKQNRTFYEFAT